ncbi:MAG TPA: lipoprotein-releasing ABC transporter permease subunit [Deltaproteobacteria bacterium]|nr:MAG: ABC transporter permease [Deltaproteobacteria bacterium GWA2_55_82]OGQ64266.1 MAG: ABC transporter permease [Deltaproteobacteria bacterium RIFCSPLOWO2_02_FULL_55_12]OIJ73992.1 MAG: ABC transporter permease [Deltaproteobacteria bacterium GWC2_55_46]HBG46596.1 lipoprotein-releasing ABC transporter permease subunit [Deltaproteobacteria bacterium]HCY11396.1 lipoprotein-releasing ABC transporter permease subunit [Deltaproteobacteria bacterium]
MASYELFIGLRYLKAKRKQTFISVITFISILGITVGVTALIIVLSVMTGFEENLREKILGINANVVITELGAPMAGYRDVAEDVRKVPGVVGATPFTYNQAMISSSGGVVGAVIRGLDMETTGEVTVLPGKMKEGSLEGLKPRLVGSNNSGDAGIVIGRELAGNLGVSVGDVLNVISPMGTMTPAGPVPRMAAFRVAGIFELGMYEYDSSLAFISLENAQSFFRMGDAASGVEVRIKDIYKAQEVADSIMMELKGPYWTRTWMEMNRNLFSALRLEKAAMFIILTLIILVAALNIISTLIMVVMEKGKDVAILKSLGATSGGIMKIFMIEGLIIGVAGTALGTIVGVAAAMNLERIVQFIERVFHFKVLPPSIYYIDKFPSKVEPTVVIAIVVISIAISFAATLYPSWQASKFDPVEGLRYE